MPFSEPSHPAPAVPPEWMPDAAMRRIHLHWTAGAHRANEVDLRAYHLLIEGDGQLRRGLSGISANDPALRGPAEVPAQHTLNANSHAIGVALCAMQGAREHPFHPGPAPLTQAQWQTAVAVIACLARRYGVPIGPRSILTHAEVAGNLGIAQRAKWDITRLPFDPATRGAGPVGDRLRHEVALALTAAAPAPTPAPTPAAAPAAAPAPNVPPALVSFVAGFRVADTGGKGLNLRQTPGGQVLATLPEGTGLSQIDRQGDWWRVRAADGRTGWVAARYLVKA